MVSVVVACQVLGSAVPDFHTFAFSVVVPVVATVPTVWNLTRRTPLAATVTPETVWLTNVVSVPPNRRPNEIDSEPLLRTRTLAR